MMEQTATNKKNETGVARAMKGLRDLFPYLGPAFLVSVGYMDPGNWGTDIDGGARFGYMLLWVLLMSNLMAILLQTLSAKLGLVTGKDLAENCRDRFSKPLSLFLWATAEIAVMATDLAEFLGSALGIHLLFGVPLVTAVFITGLDVFLILGFQRWGYRVLEYVIIAFVATIGVCYVFEIILSKPAWGPVLFHTFVPQINAASLYVAIGMLGATVMPHNLFLHSSLIKTRIPLPPKEHVPGEPDPETRKIYRFAVIDSIIALNGAFFVNAAILIMSAAVFNSRSLPVASIEEAHKTLTPLLGGGAAFTFALALLCSGLSSSTTGTLAGQIVMEGFLHIRWPLWFRRLATRAITMIPAIVAIVHGVDPLKILVLSQVCLSFQLPFAILPLIHFTSRKDLMREHTNTRLTNVLAGLTASIIIALNGVLLYLTFRPA